MAPLAIKQSFLSPSEPPVCKIHNLIIYANPTHYINSVALYLPSVEHLSINKQNKKLHYQILFLNIQQSIIHLCIMSCYHVHAG